MSTVPAALPDRFPGCRRPTRRLLGFTLIELMIAIAIVAILAAVALPGYQSHIRKSRRAVAAACLEELAQQMERRYTTQMNYTGTTLPAAPCIADLQNVYLLQFANKQPTATTFTLQAVPQGPQDKDEACMTLSLNEQGVRERTGSADVKSCWP
jgi:type IV pilus assembly protein PilE